MRRGAFNFDFNASSSSGKNEPEQKKRMVDKWGLPKDGILSLHGIDKNGKVLPDAKVEIPKLNSSTIHDAYIQPTIIGPARYVMSLFFIYQFFFIITLLSSLVLKLVMNMLQELKLL